jgi:hypothetical protein
MSRDTNQIQAATTRGRNWDLYGAIAHNQDGVTKCEGCAKSEECFGVYSSTCGYIREGRSSHSGAFTNNNAYVYTKQKPHGPTRAR